MTPSSSQGKDTEPIFSELNFYFQQLTWHLTWKSLASPVEDAPKEDPDVSAPCPTH